MKETFDSILTSVLDVVSENASVSEETLLQKAKELGLSDSGQNAITEALKCLDAFEEKMESLQTAKEDDDSREQWLRDQLREITQKYNVEDADTFVNQLNMSISESCKETLEKGE